MVFFKSNTYIMIGSIYQFDTTSIFILPISIGQYIQYRIRKPFSTKKEPYLAIYIRYREDNSLSSEDILTKLTIPAYKPIIKVILL